MGLRLLIGRAGTGKTTYCMEEIAKRQSNLNERLILLVPEQYSSQAEMDLIQKTNAKGILFAEVLSFGRLAHHMLAKVGMNKGQILGDTGKAMVLRKIMMDSSDELTFFKKAVDKQGFVEQLCSTMTELCQYCIDAEQLLKQSQNEEHFPALREKLHDLSLIYDAYTHFIKERYFSGDSLLDILAQVLSSEGKFENTEIWIDGFYGFTPQEYQIIKQLLRLCNHVNITLTMDQESLYATSMPPTAPFFEAYITKCKLLEIAESIGVKNEQPILFKDNHRNAVSGLHFLEQNFLRHFGRTSFNHEGLQIIAAQNPDMEIRHTAVEILRCVREESFRYRDIAVVTNAMGEYEKSLCGILEEYGIPYFIDRKKEISSHPFVALVCNLLDIFVYHFQYEGVFGYLKTGLGPLSRKETDKLENYVLAAGIKGYSWFSDKRWRSGILRGREGDIFDILQSRDVALEPLLSFQKNFDRRKEYPAKEMALGILDIFSLLNIQEKLEEIVEKCRQNGQEGRAREHGQIYKIVIDLFDKLIEILGNEKMTLHSFQKILLAGISSSSLGIIPPTADSLLVGDLERSRLPEIRGLFVLGVNEGILPSVQESGGVWTDRERAFLEREGIHLSPDSKRKAFLEQYIIYLSLGKPHDFLSFSYCKGNLEGKKMRSSSIISRLHQMFPSLHEVDATAEDKLFQICRPAACMHKIGEEMYQGAQGETMHPIWQDVYSFFLENGKYQQKLLSMRSALVADVRNQKLSKHTINKMFKRDIYTSVSKLEQYASCPFSYFAEYGLEARERQLYELRLPDLGLLFHSVLELFAQMCSKNGKDWFLLSQEETEDLIEMAVDESAPKLGNQILFDTAANRYLIKRLKRVSKRAAWTLAQHVQMGSFRPVGFEIGFGEGQTLPPIVIELANEHRLVLRGKIDRIDIMDAEQKSYVKIIDYKSGSKAFSFQDIYYGLQLQLLVYLDAYMKSLGTDRAFFPGGIFYFQIKDETVAITNEMTAEEIYSLLFRDMRMSGLALSNPEVISGLDNTFIIDEKGNLSKGTSSIIPVSVKTNGEFAQRGTVVANEKNYEQLIAFALQKSIDIGEAICKGEIAPYPIRREGMSPCVYCKYGSICGFLGDNPEGYRKLKNIDENNFWNLIEAKDEK